MTVSGMTRAELAAEVARLRADGLVDREVAARLGISRSYAAELRLDPTGERSRARKDSYAQPCMDCGAPTSGSEGRRAEPRCQLCANVKAGAARKVWTEERIIAAIQWWNDRYGEPPALVDWSPTHAKYLGDTARARRAERHIAARDIPWFITAVRAFGSWNSAIRAAGFEPRQPVGTSENHRRSQRARQQRAAA